MPDEVSILCVAPTVVLWDLGLNLVRGQRASVSRAKADSSVDLARESGARRVEGTLATGEPWKAPPSVSSATVERLPPGTPPRLSAAPREEVLLLREILAEVRSLRQEFDAWRMTVPAAPGPLSALPEVPGESGTVEPEAQLPAEAPGDGDEAVGPPRSKRKKG